MPDTAPAMVRQGRGLISCSTEFINGCGIVPPFYLVFISTNGSVIVTHWSAVGEVHDVCERLHEIAVLPIVLAVISLDGRCASARIVGGDH